MFVTDYCEVNFFKKKSVCAALMLIPVIGLLAVWTVERHTLFYRFYYYDPGSLHHLNIVVGPLYILTQGYALLLVLGACAILIQHIICGNKTRRAGLMLILAAIATLIVAQMVHVSGAIFSVPWLTRLNLTPYCLIFVVGAYYINMIWFDLFDLIPKAHEITLDLIKDAFILVDSEMKYVSSNLAAKEIFDDLADLNKGRRITELEDWPERLNCLDLRVADDNGYQGIRFVMYQNRKRTYTARVNPIMAKKGLLGWTILFQDITEYVTMVEEMQHIAYTDSLTDLHNRRHFMELAESKLAKAGSSEHVCSIIIFDVDRFKRINDVYGHLAGDAVLKLVAQSVKEIIRSYDILARYGGDEFVILMSDSDDRVANQLADRIRCGVEQAVCQYGEHRITMTCSVGIAKSDGSGSLEDLLREADVALYKAKEKGRNKVLQYRRKGFV
jgi:diguanylate cyclase (GGDEF)-like protein